MDKAQSTEKTFCLTLFYGTARAIIQIEDFSSRRLCGAIGDEELWIPGTTQHVEKRRKRHKQRKKRRRRRKMIILLPPTLSPYKTHISNTTNNR